MLRSEPVSGLNLARRPLVNRRPLRRVVTFLWVAAGLVLAIDAAVLVRHLTSSYTGRENLVELDQEVAAEVESLRRLDKELRGYDLEAQNRHVEFLNQKIAQRTFPWSQLFEQLGGVLPEGVRLQSLRPAISEDDEPEEAPRRRRSQLTQEAPQPSRWVLLRISGEAETSEAILELVDALFQHPAFSSPNLRNEAQDRNAVRFNLSVRYLPDLVSEQPEGAEEATAEETTAGPAPSRERVGTIGGSP